MVNLTTLYPFNRTSSETAALYVSKIITLIFAIKKVLSWQSSDQTLTICLSHSVTSLNIGYLQNVIRKQNNYYFITKRRTILVQRQLM